MVLYRFSFLSFFFGKVSVIMAIEFHRESTYIGTRLFSTLNSIMVNYVGRNGKLLHTDKLAKGEFPGRVYIRGL